MIIRKLTASDRAQAEAMWRDIFEEAPTFTSYYFEKRFRPEHSFGAFEADRLVAMAQGRPTEIFVEGKVLPALLVAGVSTLPEYRRQGLMHKLMTLLIDHAKSNGFACCYLHPVTESLYASLGFRNGTDALIAGSDGTRAHEAFVLKEGTEWDDLLSVYNAVLNTHDGMQMRDTAELMTVFADYATEDARTLIAYENESPVGYICYSADGSVFELFALRSSAYACLLDEAAKRANKDLKAIVPVDCGIAGERHYSMQYLVFCDAFRLPLKNGFCRLAY